MNTKNCLAFSQLQSFLSCMYRSVLGQDLRGPLCKSLELSVQRCAPGQSSPQIPAFLAFSNFHLFSQVTETTGLSLHFPSLPWSGNCCFMYFDLFSSCLSCLKWEGKSHPCYSLMAGSRSPSLSFTQHYSIKMDYNLVYQFPINGQLGKYQSI